MELLRKVYLFLLDSVQTFLIAAAVFLVIYVFLFRPFEVNGVSMYPNFYDKEYVLTNLIILRFENPKLGDVIVFKAPPDPNKDYIKRVIGLPGDSIMVKDGSVFRNGNLLDESKYLKSSVKTYEGAFLKNGQAVNVPQDEYFVFGDNRGESSDSRDWGFVRKDEIIGESLFVYWPLNRMRFISSPY
jgi:signal peptidase I